MNMSTNDSKELLITTPNHNGRPKLVLAGRLTSASASQLQRACLKASQEIAGGELEVDVSGLTYIDSLSIGMLIKLNEVGKAAGKPLVLTHAKGPVRDVFRMLHMEKMIAVR